MIIDSHTHYEHKRFDPDRDALIQSLPSRGVDLVINIGCDLPSSKDSIKLAETYNHVYAAVGVHPHEAKTLDENVLQKLIDMTKHEKVVAYGEIGLDFHYNFSPPDVQRAWFKRQLEVARALDMPVVIHSREAGDEVFEMIQASEVRRGVIHSFSGEADLAMAYTAMGFHIGINGVVTFDKTGVLQAAVAAIPLEKILLETDCPYMTPVPFRGKRNASHYLTYVAEEIAKIKGETIETICAQTSANTRALFNLL